MRRSRFLLFMTLAAVAAIVFLVLDGCSGQEVETKTEGPSSSFQVIDEAYKLIKEKGVYPVEGDALVEGALRGMADVIGDPYSTYFTEEEAKAHKESLAGERVGIGAEITRSNGKFIIVAPVKSSPAEKAGLQPYDEIVQIDGKRLDGSSLQDVVKRIRGKEGTAVKMTIYRPDLNKHLELSITREVIPVKTVTGKIIEQRGEKIGYIAITMFGEDSAAEWKKVTDELIQKGAKALLVDVRGNPGGYLHSVGNIAGSLLSQDTVFAHMQEANGTLTPLVTDSSKKFAFDEKLKNIPIALLQDKGSASASEVLSGALKDLKRGYITGTTSFGKGTVQETMDLSNGGEMKLSTHKWLTPKERWIHGKGVEPDLEVKQNDLFKEHVRPVMEKYKEGDFHDDIAYAQRLLIGLGYGVERKDGYFDESTVMGVTDFRADAKLDEGDVMDRKFFTALKEKVEKFRKDEKNDEQLQMAIGYLHHKISNK
ncbi:S41 family peptidase [Sporosarcina sp. HYO08]|uniref:S41 family peptidase n=1 Tax=Sporosarcina sp. HYO08 TaxID=1759557 RepID=UPI000792F065|nr:S41 family peptidase [Sporosarcina sp. HYO08]KXH79749.1 peptidase S41 [Sporosarcina sp. HYO08]